MSDHKTNEDLELSGGPDHLDFVNNVNARYVVLT